ncbi:dynein regulatory complex protein 9 isoform X1 [Bombyx mori]|uniref:Dynein regulatory complex protein 9 n=2 Tax=Bombyx mori TaxID=7091 RepID=A0A8R1WGN2_BOMMO|nr:dynein regulatory complex protein 9 isoform X1 [Bombyx mori]
MTAMRVKNLVSEQWGHATIYTDSSRMSQKQELSSLYKRSLSQLLQMIPETITVTEEDTMPVEEYTQPSLSYMSSSMFATILEDTIIQIRILDECNSELRIIKTLADIKLLRALKFGIAQPKTADELENIDPKNLECENYKIYKLDSDRRNIINAITDLYVEMTLNKNYKTLTSFLNSIFDKEHYRIALAENEAKNKLERRELTKQIRQLRNHIKTVLYDNEVTIDSLKSQVEDSVLDSECSSRYVDNWQVARTEQHLEVINEAENSCIETIEQYKLKIEHEQRIHSEVELLTNITINETLEKIEKWMSKYDRDMEGIDIDMQRKKNHYQDMRDKRINFENTIEKHDLLMKQWINFKEEREKARIYRENMTKSAIIVQAWWRGLLVRRRLGPYRVGRKRRGRKKK